ncbi:MAG TPA: pyridoxal-dependent decarboxylase [Caulobacteraceae bacterium]|nr:pyridoxal-dependent decarboxylase [Caulobacteraceae bacterium]
MSTPAGQSANDPPEGLDPADWAALRAQAHRMLDDMLDHVQGVSDGPVRRPIPGTVRAVFAEPLSTGPSSLEAVHRDFLDRVLPYGAGNGHPGFMGWVHGGGTVVGMLGEMLAAGLNANLGGRDQSPILLERQVARWAADLFGFPETASGLFVTGTSIANFIAVLVARRAALGAGVRTGGVAGTGKRLVAYAGAAAHGCVPSAFDMAGIGSDALRLIPSDADGRIEVASLEAAIRADRAAGAAPFMLVGTAGSVDIGAIDDLTALADLAEREGLWLHVDGAFGALAMLSPALAPRLKGIERAQSIAFDFHKWGQVPYDAGFILVRDREAHRAAFAADAAYLKQAATGLAGGSPWPCDFGPDLSRGFRALKTWFTLRVLGPEAIGASILKTCQMAAYLAARVDAAPELERLAPVGLNIVCFRFADAPGDLDALNAGIVARLQDSGVAAPSTTTLGGRLAIRAAIVNHRTREAHIDALVEGVLALGRSAAAERSRQPLSV